MLFVHAVAVDPARSAELERDLGVLMHCREKRLECSARLFRPATLAGDQGLSAWNGLQSEEAELETRLADLEAERATLEKSLVRLRDTTLDLDYVEEIARTRLSYVRPDEVLVAVR